MSDSTMETPAGLSPQAKRELLGRLLKLRARAASTAEGEAPGTAAAAEFEPFPLRDIQQAYWIGRGSDFELGNVGAFVYFEIESIRLDLTRLGAALNTLIQRHGMLRAIVLPNGQQQILADVPVYEVAVLDLSAETPATVAAELEALRTKLSHRLLPTDRWPLFDLRVTLVPGQRLRIHVGIDLLIADLRSIYILLSEWFQLYVDPEGRLPPIRTAFRDYVLREHAQEETGAFARAEAYWRRRIEDLPPAPELPLAKPLASIADPRFTRRTARFSPDSWARLRNQAERHHVTPASVLLAAFGWVLTSWSRSPRLTVDVTIFNRLPLHPDVNRLVGDFTSVIFAAVDHSKRESFSARSKRVNEELWEALDHREFSGVRVLRELLRKSGGPGRAVMPIVFTCDLRHDLVSVNEGRSELVPGEIVYGVSQTPQVYLDHQVFEERGGLTVNWDSVEELFPEGMLQEMLDANMRLLEELARNDRFWIDPAVSPTSESHLRLVSSANSTAGPVSNELLHSGFAAQAQHHPDAVAIVAGERTMSYRELFECAEGIGRTLRDSGAGPGCLVAVVMEKGWEQIASVMGILHAGSAYLPIDPELPPERVRYLLEHGRVRVALTQSRVDAALQWPDGIDRICVDRETPASGRTVVPTPLQNPDDLAYVIYTSGSTGAPKGVMIDHRGAVNTITDINERFSVGPGDRILALASLSFDLSVYDIFGALSAGATIVFPPPADGPDPAAWVDVIQRERVTIWNSVPAMAEALVDYLESRRDRTIDSLRLMMLSGDWIPVTLPDRIRSVAGGAAVVSLGGATEASIWSILYPIGETDPAWESIPYGKPMRNQRFYVLDDQLDSRPVGVPGELYIGGIGLAKGYWQDEEKTAARFIAHPLTGERLYRTGDHGAYLHDGNIRFLGREDLQVKIQGYRVELGEIEAALVQHPDVRAAVATADGEPRGAKRLLAYVVCRSEPGPADQQLKEFLRGKLPQYMVPGAIVRLNALPLTANGKIDRSALPSPTSPAVGASDASTAEIAGRLNQLISSALHVESIDPNANLTDLGANSLDMLRVGNQLETEFGFRPTMQEFFRFPSIAGLARYYEQRLAAGKDLDAGTRPSLAGREPGSVWQSFRLLTDPADRLAFKSRQPGLRDVEGRDCLLLPGPDRAGQAFTRRSQRTFGREPIPLGQFSAFLGHLGQVSPGQTKRQYASAGGLYAVQTYLHVKERRIDGVPAGAYYYDPGHHRLVPLVRDAVLDRNIHWSENRIIFDEAAFSIFLVAQLSAIAPLYQERSLHLVTIEAGLMSQLLETAAPGCDVGLCHIGDVNFEPIRPMFALDESHVLVHTLLGGPVDRTREPDGEEPEDPTIAGPAPAGPQHAPFALDGAGLSSINVSALKTEAVLAPEIRFDGSAAASETPSRILLTGATGFLGAFLLRELLDRTSADICCLVRASDAAAGRRRLQRNLDRYGLWSEHAADRVVPLIGDLAEPRLGLSVDGFADLAGGIDAVYHSGALVHLVRPYDELKPINVGGTHEVLRLASLGRGTPVHFVSSVAVFPFVGGRLRSERDSLDHGEDLIGGYAQSKWVAEQLVTLARSRGLRVCVYRPSTITGHSGTGAFSDDSYFENLIRGCIELGSAPDVDAPVDLVPVDFAAAAIVALSQRRESPGGVFHLTNPVSISMSSLIDFMNAGGHRVRRVSYQAWQHELLSLGQRFERNALYPFGAFIARLAEGPAMASRYDCSATRAALEGAAIACPAPDDALLRVYFDRYVSGGFLKPPQP